MWREGGPTHKGVQSDKATSHSHKHRSRREIGSWGKREADKEESAGGDGEAVGYCVIATTCLKLQQLKGRGARPGDPCAPISDRHSTLRPMGRVRLIGQSTRFRKANRAAWDGCLSVPLTGPQADTQFNPN